MAGSLSSCAARCLWCRSLTSFGSRGAARLIRLLAFRLGILLVGRCRWHGGSWLLFLRPPWLVRLASAGEVIRRVCRSCGSSRRLPHCPRVLAWRRASCLLVSFFFHSSYRLADM